MESISGNRKVWASLLLGCVAISNGTPARAQDSPQTEPIALPEAASPRSNDFLALATEIQQRALEAASRKGPTIKIED